MNKNDGEDIPRKLSYSTDRKRSAAEYQEGFGTSENKAATGDDDDMYIAPKRHGDFYKDFYHDFENCTDDPEEKSNHFSIFYNF